MRYLLFSGSFRTDSLNKKLVGLVANILSETKENHITVAEIRDLAIPVYDGDVEAKGIPAGVKQLGELIKESHAIIVSSPEYNSSIAGPLKNTIDWVSRLKPFPFEGKPVFLMSASPGAFGGIRGLSATKAPFELMGAYVYPQMFPLSKAHEAMKEGKLVDDAIQKRLVETLEKFSVFSKKLI